MYSALGDITCAFLWRQNAGHSGSCTPARLQAAPCNTAAGMHVACIHTCYMGMGTHIAPLQGQNSSCNLRSSVSTTAILAVNSGTFLAVHSQLDAPIICKHQHRRSCWIVLRSAWLATTPPAPGGRGCRLSGSTPGWAASHSSRAARSKLWPPLPKSTGSRMTSPLSVQRHQSCCADAWAACTAGCCSGGPAAAS